MIKIEDMKNVNQEIYSRLLSQKKPRHRNTGNSLRNGLNHMSKMWVGSDSASAYPGNNKK
jgi:hypothetical protein